MRAILLVVAALLAAFLLTFSGGVALALFSAQVLEQPKIAQLSAAIGPVLESSLDRMLTRQIGSLISRAENASFTATCETIECAKAFMEREADNFLAGVFSPEVNTTGIFEECVARDVKACEEGFLQKCERKEIEQSCTIVLENRKLSNGLVYPFGMGLTEDMTALLKVPRTQLDEQVAVVLVTASNLALKAVKSVALTRSFNSLVSRCEAFYENVTKELGGLEVTKRCGREIFDALEAISKNFTIVARPLPQFPACAQFRPALVNAALYQDKAGRDSKWPMYRISQAISAAALAKCSEQFLEAAGKQQLCLRPISAFLTVQSIGAMLGGQAMYTVCVSNETTTSTELLAKMANQEAARRGWPEIQKS